MTLTLYSREGKYNIQWQQNITAYTRGKICLYKKKGKKNANSTTNTVEP